MLVLGLTGPFGSGCTRVCRDYLERQLGFKAISLSDVLCTMYEQRTGSRLNTRHEKQDFGNELRRTDCADVLARKACDEIGEADGSWVVDSIRNPAEIAYLKSQFPDFYLIGVYADRMIRWNRVKGQYVEDRAAFERDEQRDREEKLRHGQHVDACFNEADVIISNELDIHLGNDNDIAMKTTVETIIDTIRSPGNRMPTLDETIMAMTYAISRRSQCFARQVGALLVDSTGNVFGSGFNEVPESELTCKRRYGGCYRRKLIEEFDLEIAGLPETAKDSIHAFFRQYKILDQCRALHAEERAILNAKKLTSVDMRDCTLYTTTYPCNMCANKIAKVGIGQVVYFEAYPGEQARKILTTKGVKQRTFQGVTFNGYFRLFRRDV